VAWHTAQVRQVIASQRWSSDRNYFGLSSSTDAVDLPHKPGS